MPAPRNWRTSQAAGIPIFLFPSICLNDNKACHAEPSNLKWTDDTSLDRRDKWPHFLTGGMLVLSSRICSRNNTSLALNLLFFLLPSAMLVQNAEKKVKPKEKHLDTKKCKVNTRGHFPANKRMRAQQEKRKATANGNKSV